VLVHNGRAMNTLSLMGDLVRSGSGDNFQRRVTKARQLLLSKSFNQAFSLYGTLVKENASDAAVWFEYGNAASALRHLEVAGRAWDRALDLAGGNAELIGLIGHQYQAMRQPEKARLCFARAATADPRSINPRISLAVLAEQNHRLDEARAAVEQCLAIDPRDDQARYFAALLDRRENQLERAERLLRELIASEPRHPYVRYACRYELAQILDRTERFDEAIAVLAEAKRIVSTLTDTRLLLNAYDQGANSTRRFVDSLPRNILRTWADFFPSDKREAIPQLAFLGGHPRSGTTLLEQILDAHPGIAAVDESSAFLKLLQPEFHKSKSLSTARLNTLRRLYIQELLSELGPAAEGKFLVDKNPSPTARMPLWLKVFPELRVIIALRDPRDVVLSCYFQNIPLNPANVNFLSLERICKHYSDLMDVWLAVREWEGFAWLETRYEKTISDLESEGKRVTEFLGLKWDPDQGRFYDQKRQKQLYSPTYQDVTRPVYNRSVGRWHCYEKHLAPILPALTKYLNTFGYD
jgi:tetratricopeptide (TPR) repeat protein